MRIHSVTDFGGKIETAEKNIRRAYAPVIDVSGKSKIFFRLSILDFSIYSAFFRGFRFIPRNWDFFRGTQHHRHTSRGRCRRLSSRKMDHLPRISGPVGVGRVFILCLFIPRFPADFDFFRGSAEKIPRQITP